VDWKARKYIYTW